MHEIGHTLHWPHSYSTKHEYDNRVDVMSGEPDDGWCTKPAPGGYSCGRVSPSTRWRSTASRADGSTAPQVAIHRAGTVNYTLDAPATDGLQFVALPDASEPRSMLTIEARPRVGRDRFLEAEGVALHVVDQVPRGGISPASAPVGANDRRSARRTATTTSLGVGATVTVHGVTVTVLGRTGDSYDVTVSGSYRDAAAELLHRRRYSAARVVRDARDRGGARSRLRSVDRRRRRLT